MKRVSSGSPLEGEIGFSRAVRVGNFIAVAGTAPIPGGSGRVDTWSVYEQTRLCLQMFVRRSRTLEDTWTTSFVLALC